MLYQAQVVKVWGRCTTNLCILAQVAEIYGPIEGRLYFRGQVLTIHPTAVLKNGMDVEAQKLVRKGQVKGPVTGQFQTYED